MESIFARAANLPEASGLVEDLGVACICRTVRQSSIYLFIQKGAGNGRLALVQFGSSSRRFHRFSSDVWFLRFWSFMTCFPVPG